MRARPARSHGRVAVHPDALRWNRKYASRDRELPFEVDPALAALAPRLGSPGLALDVASGACANALWLAARGWRVVCADVSVEGLRLGAARARRCGTGLASVVADSRALPFGRAARFDLVLVTRYLDRTLFDWIPGVLAPGGRVFWCTFNEGHLRSRPRFCRDWVLHPGELGRAFAGLERLAGEEGPTSSWILCRRR